MQVTARFVSCSDAPLVLRVRTSFMDSNQFPTEPTSAWQPVHIQPRTIAHYSESSIATNVGYYLIEVMLTESP